MNATADTSASDSPRGKYHGCLSSPSIRRNDVLVTHRAAIVEAAKRRNFRGVALVGSVARGENASDSDVDFLVECDPERSTLFDLTGLGSCWGWMWMSCRRAMCDPRVGVCSRMPYPYDQRRPG